MANIQSGGDATLLTVDPVSNAARVSLYDSGGGSLVGKNGANLPAVPGALTIGGINDGAYRSARFDRYGNIRPGTDTLLFRDTAETGATSGTPISPNLNQWTTSVSGFAVGAPTVNGNQLTATTVVTANAYSIATSLRQFQKLQKSPLFYRRRGRNVQVANTVSEFGFGSPTTNTPVVPNGAFWRFTSGGLVIPVIAFNGAEIIGTDISASLSNVNYYTWEVIVDDDDVVFICQDVSTGRSISEQSVPIPKTQVKIWGVSRLPVFERVYNGATAPATAPTILFSDVYVCSLDVVGNKPWYDQISGATQGAAEVFPGAYVAANAQNANMANSTAPTSGTLSNTAASYATLGGQFQFVAVAGAETDYALFAFTVPVGFTFFATGIHISTFNTVAAVATTPTLMQWSVANNSSAVSLATVGLARSALGSQSLPIGLVAGGNVPDLDVRFSVPKRTDGGRIFHVILKMPVATATATEVIRGTVFIDGYFE